MDNFYLNCPAKMSDGRIFTDYRSDTRKNEYIKYLNNITRDDDYRIFLQKNGKQIIENEFNYYKKKQSCNDMRCVHQYPTQVYAPWFVNERENYDFISKYPNTKKFPCTPIKDNRLNNDLN